MLLTSYNMRSNPLCGFLRYLDGERDAEIVWQFHRGVPECPSPLYVEGRVYRIENGGIASCLDAESGELQYRERLDSGGPYYFFPVVGNGPCGGERKIYAASARGIVTAYETGDTLKALARNDLQERIMATPALLQGRVYVRTEQALYAFGLPQ